MDVIRALELLDNTRLSLNALYPFLTKWDVSFDNAKKRAGVCRLTDKTISISLLHIENNEPSVVLDTVLHEFAHAIAFEMYAETGHGAIWQRVALEIGATPKATGKYNLPDAPWFLVSYCKIENRVERVAPRFRKNKSINKYALKGRPETKGRLFYVKAGELVQFELGYIGIDKLNLIQ